MEADKPKNTKSGKVDTLTVENYNLTTHCRLGRHLPSLAVGTRAKNRLAKELEDIETANLVLGTTLDDIFKFIGLHNSPPRSLQQQNPAPPKKRLKRRSMVC